MYNQKLTLRHVLFMLSTVFLFIAITSCKVSQQAIDAYTYANIKSTDKWNSLADSLQVKLYNSYLSRNGKYFMQDHAGNSTFHYWHNAHTLDVLVDGYERTNDSAYILKMKNLLQGIYQTNKRSFINDFYDDMGWLGVASLRAYKNTSDIEYLNTAKLLWKDILTGINNRDGRSLSWSKPTPEFKNTPAQGPAIIMGLRLYKITQDKSYKDTAVKMYNWLSTMLVNDKDILIDGIKNGKLEKYIYTYNQGLYIGASLEMYNLTNDKKCFQNALKTAHASMNDSFISPGGILRNEGQGDGGLFKGIFVRYFTELILHKDITEKDKTALLNYLVKNAETLYSSGVDHKSLFINYDWNKKPTEVIDLSTQLSGMMLIESMAKMQKLGLVK